MEIQPEYGLYIDGEEQHRSAVFDVHDPATEEQLTSVADATGDDARTAIESASNAVESWQAIDSTERGSVLSAVADELRADIDAFAELETRETGRPVAKSKLRIEAAIGFFEYYAGLADKIEGDTIPVPGDRLNYTVREPLGVTGHIIPWNSPSLLGARSIAPALVCGNAVVAKPSPEAPLTTLRLARACTRAGVPPGVFNVVPDSDSAAGKAITESPIVDGVSFTGSRAAGEQVMKAAATNITHVDLELGGNAPCLVFPDADLESIASDLVKSYGNAGQTCFALSRFFVHEDVYDEFVDAFVAEIESLTVGPWTESPDIGPVISAEARDRVAETVREAEEDGARILTGGTIPRETGHFYAPTLVGEVADDAAIACEELFGPVKTLHEFSTEDEVLDRANDSQYGLYAAVYTTDVSRAHRLSAELEVGSIAVNEYPLVFEQAPFGGYKESGLGRTKGKAAIENYTEIKNVTISFE